MVACGVNRVARRTSLPGSCHELNRLGHLRAARLACPLNLMLVLGDQVLRINRVRCFMTLEIAAVERHLAKAPVMEVALGDAL